MPQSKVPVFDPRELRTIQELCDGGHLPFHPKTVERLCRKGALPAVKADGWRTTENAARNFLWKRANAAFKQTHC